MPFSHNTQPGLQRFLRFPTNPIPHRYISKIKIQLDKLTQYSVILAIYHMSGSQNNIYNPENTIIRDIKAKIYEIVTIMEQQNTHNN